MSIAMSAMLRPSLYLALLSLAMAAVLLMASVVLLATDAPCSQALAVTCAIAAAGLGLFPLSTIKFQRIDVTGLGQILLTHTGVEVGGGRTRDVDPAAEVVQLLRESTLWSTLMVLRLRSVSGRKFSLVLLPDSMDREAFRALSVACRWVAARNGKHHALPTEILPRPD